MRRSLILAALLAALVTLGGTGPGGTPATAAEGDPDDYCSFSPDYPLGWAFNDACRAHDACIDSLPPDPPLEVRLDCDEFFFADLLAAPHTTLERVCQESPLCRALATVYYRVVRYVTLLFAGEVELPEVTSGVSPSSRAP